ncbi:regulatory protein TspO [Halorhodospira halochloris]|uniref:Regulatory protein TspO n=2 Tax=Halorhodospira halochloris TaxID=1052 RepID=A0A0X8X943_HALHR|nr:sensory protein TspO [Halorhodospira halochloris]BAU57228.1 regulatory protein TspO [Halorhodospira halochloris]
MSLMLFLIFLAACAVAAATGHFFGPGQWYAKLNKPEWTPPNWVFPLGWAIMYPAMAIAAWRVGISGHDLVPLALALWALQLALNTLWTPIFFGLQQIFTALVAICCMWVAVLFTTGVFLTVDWLAGLLFLLYLAWASFASALNYEVWKRNSDVSAEG